jgi:hypothetical protein
LAAAIRIETHQFAIEDGIPDRQSSQQCAEPDEWP